MFGYIKPDMPELKVREKQRYEAWYCGLCRALSKRYGQAPRLMLSYDAAFLGMFVSAAAGYPSPCAQHACPAHPLLKRKLMVDRSNPALDFASDACVILAKFKLDDDVRDGRPARAAVKLPLLHAFRRAKKLNGELYSAVEKHIKELCRIEEEGEPSLDAAANGFGEMMRSVFLLAPLGKADSENNRCVLGETGFWIGRTIYLLDAWDDREKDAKKKLYNPFNLLKTEREEAEYLVNFSINSAISAYNLLEPAEKHPDLAIVENILFRGFFAVWDSIVRREAEEQNNSERKDGLSE